MGWAYQKENHRFTPHRDFVEYLRLNELENLSSALLEFVYGTQVNDFFMQLKDQLKEARKTGRKIGFTNYSARNFQVSFPELDFNHLENIVSWWELHSDAGNERLLNNVAFDLDTVVKMYTNAFQGWKRADPLNKLMVAAGGITEPSSFATMKKKDMDYLGKRLFIYVQEGLVDHIRNKLKGEESLSAVIEESLLSLYKKRIGLNDYNSLKEYAPSFYRDKKLISKKEALQLLDRDNVLARKVVMHFSQYLFKSAYYLTPVRYSPLNPANIKTAAKEILTAYYTKFNAQ
jgi:hypothetical protein